MRKTCAFLKHWHCLLKSSRYAANVAILTFSYLGVHHDIVRLRRVGCVGRKDAIWHRQSCNLMQCAMRQRCSKLCGTHTWRELVRTQPESCTRAAPRLETILLQQWAEHVFIRADL